MRFGICTSLDHLLEAREAGFDYVETSAANLLSRQSEADFTFVRERILNAPIAVEAFYAFLPGDLKVTGPDVDLAAVAAYMETTLRRASEVGGKIMVFGSGRARRIPDGFPLSQGYAQFLDAAKLAAETASRYGMHIVLEPLSSAQCNFFNRVDEGAEIVGQVNHPNLRLLTDLYHMTAAEEPFDNIVAAGDRLMHVHLATPAIPETGEGVAYDFAGFIHAVARAGYDLRMSIEDNPGLLGKQQLPLTHVYRAVLDYVKSFMPVTA